MIIYLKKFGTTLTSRQGGKEAYAAFLPVLREVKSDEQVVLDFDGVITFSPSWGDEFVRPLREMFPDRLFFKQTDNASVKATFEMLERVYGETLKTKMICPTCWSSQTHTLISGMMVEGDSEISVTGKHQKTPTKPVQKCVDCDTQFYSFFEKE